MKDQQMDKWLRSIEAGCSFIPDSGLEMTAWKWCDGCGRVHACAHGERDGRET